MFDCLPLYPPWLVPQPLSRLQAWYMQVFNDKLLAMPQPAWFRFFSLAELLFQLPCAAYAACLLSCGSGSSSSSTRQSYAVAVPVMLVFGTVSAFATATCVWDIFRDDDAGMTTAQKAMVGGLYSCYGVVCMFPPLPLLKGRPLRADVMG